MGPGPAKLPCGAPDRGVGSGRPALRYANGGSGAAAVPAQPAQQQQPRASTANIFEDIMAYIPDVKSDRDHDSDEVSADDGDAVPRLQSTATSVQHIRSSYLGGGPRQLLQGQQQQQQQHQPHSQQDPAAGDGWTPVGESMHTQQLLLTQQTSREQRGDNPHGHQQQQQPAAGASGLPAGVAATCVLTQRSVTVMPSQHKPSFSCLLLPCVHLDSAILEACSGKIDMTHHWKARRVDAFQVLHSMTSGRGPVLKLLPNQSRDHCDQFINWHAECQKESKLPIVRLPDGREVLLLAMTVSDSNDVTVQMAVFCGYCLTMKLAELGAELQEKTRLVVVLDLDETVVESYDAKKFRKRINELRTYRAYMEVDLQLEHDQDARGKLEKKLKVLEKEVALLEQDQRLLQQYSKNNCVQILEDRHAAELEAALDSKGVEVQRPVIRLAAQDVILTRIDPRDRASSMLVRLRPGWERFRTYLTEGSTSTRQRRYQVYVCTMGETEYAHEMVRLLDSGEFKIIPQEQRRNRIVHVPHHLKKTLPGVLSPHHCNTGDIRPDVQPGFPFAIIVDDRVDAWDCIAEHNVAQVSRWQYHCQQAVHELHPDGRSPKEANAAELSRMQGVIGSARFHAYASTGQVMRAVERRDPWLPSMTTVMDVLHPGWMQQATGTVRNPAVAVRAAHTAATGGAALTADGAGTGGQATAAGKGGRCNASSLASCDINAGGSVAANRSHGTVSSSSSTIPNRTAVTTKPTDPRLAPRTQSVKVMSPLAPPGQSFHGTASTSGAAADNKRAAAEAAGRCANTKRVKSAAPATKA